MINCTVGSETEIKKITTVESVGESVFRNADRCGDKVWLKIIAQVVFPDKMWLSFK